MAEYTYKEIDGRSYWVPKTIKPFKKAPPYVVVMNQNCTCCSGSPVCMTECPVDCIHPIYENGRPWRVYVDYDSCIGCLNCFSYEIRVRNVMQGDAKTNIGNFNAMNLEQKKGVCPWDAIEIQPYKEGLDRGKEFYAQPRHHGEAAAAPVPTTAAAAAPAEVAR